MLGLASVKRVAPRTSFAADKSGVDAETLKAIVANRFHVLKLYGRRVLAPVLHRHADDERSFPRRQIARVRKLMIREDAPLPQDPSARQWLESALQRNQTLRTVYHFMQQLKACGQSLVAIRSAQAAPGLVLGGRSQRHSRARRFARQLRPYGATGLEPPPPPLHSSVACAHDAARSPLPPR
jgi:hypothetical protein